MSELNKGNPVIVGVNAYPKVFVKENVDPKVDHYVVINQVFEYSGKYIFSFYEPATNDKPNGTDKYKNHFISFDGKNLKMDANSSFWRDNGSIYRSEIMQIESLESTIKNK